MLKKCLIGFLAVSLTMISLSPVLAAEQSGASYLLEHGYISSVDAAKNSGEVVTRGEFVSAVNNVFGIYTTNGDSFTDANYNSPYYYDMMAAKLKGYITGYGDNHAKPEETLTRIEAASAFDRLLDLPMPMDGPNFSDDKDIPKWAIGAAQRTYARGIISLYDETGNFAPFEGYTKDDMYNSLAAIVKLGLNKVRDDEIISITSFDGYEITGRLSVPSNTDNIDKLVIFVHGTGPNTYELKRQEAGIRFKYLDIFADSFTAENVAFFTYNTRGVSINDESPYYSINEKEYETYTPTNVAKDLEIMLSELKKRPEMENSKSFLYGMSEGAVIAPLSALITDIDADALILGGYPQMNMKDILNYQLAGERGFFLYTIYFNAIGQDSISRELYEADPNEIVETVFANLSFDEIDVDGDGLITVEDVKIHSKPIHEMFFKAIEEDDFQWMTENNIPLKAAWFNDHFNLGLTGDILVQLDLPIYIFHGTMDIMCPVEGVYEVQKQFEDKGKNNLHVNIYDGYDHDLNFVYWALYEMTSEAVDDIIELVAEY